MTLTLIGNILVLVGLVVSFFLGSPASFLSSGRTVIGYVDNAWKAKVHDCLSYLGPGISAVGVALCIYDVLPNIAASG